MPIVNLREPYSYDQFYVVAHAYSEELIAHGSAIASAPVLLERVASTEPPSEAFKGRLHTLVNETWELQETIRGAFWPTRGLEIRERREMTDEAFAKDIAFNRARWEPYDQAAWIRFEASVKAEVEPAFNRVREGFHALDIPTEAQNTQLETLLAFALGQLIKLEALLGENSI